MSARPFLKFAGGKSGLLPDILPRLPKRIKTYYEPFLGGGAVFFALANELRFQRAVLSDTNRELIITWVAIRDEVDAVIAVLRRLAREREIDPPSHYAAVRAQLPTKPAKIAARMIYLNRTGFNGLYRVNRAGQFNVPFGRYVNPKICDEDNLRAVSAVLQDVVIVHADFFWIESRPSRGDAVFMDPPYVPRSKTSSFVGYGADGFGPEDQLRLAAQYRRYVGGGISAVLSNSDTAISRYLYAGLDVRTVRAPRAISSVGKKRGAVNEILVCGPGEAGRLSWRTAA